SLFHPQASRRHLLPSPNACRAELKLTEREKISRGIAAGESLRTIAMRLRRASSTISREIRRNKGKHCVTTCLPDLNTGGHQNRSVGAYAETIRTISECISAQRRSIAASTSIP